MAGESDYPTSTIVVVHPDRDDGPGRMRIHRVTYALSTVLLTLLVASAVLDNATEVDIWGESSDVATARGDGYVLEVQYPTVSRPAIATPFAIVVRHPDGFDGPIDLAIRAEWLEMWDFQALYPDPSATTGDGERVVMSFDPPEGDVLRVFLDARIQPSQQAGRDGWVTLLDEFGRAVATVDFHTRVMP